MPRLALLSQSTPNHPRPPERRRRACNIVSFHNTDTLLSLVDLPFNVRKSSLLGICLDFRQFRANVTIAPARGVLAGSCPQRCPLFQWIDRLHAARSLCRLPGSGDYTTLIPGIGRQSQVTLGKRSLARGGSGSHGKTTRPNLSLRLQRRADDHHPPAAPLEPDLPGSC